MLIWFNEHITQFKRASAEEYISRMKGSIGTVKGQSRSLCTGVGLDILWWWIRQDNECLYNTDHA